MALPLTMIIAIALAVRFKKKFEDTISIAIFLIITVLYFSGIVTTFVPGLLLIYFVCGVSLIYVLINGISNPNELKAIVFSAGFAGFVILSIYFFFVSKGRYITSHDDFAHWGIAIKYYYMLSDFSNTIKTTDQSIWYPPVATLWSYFFTKTWVTCSTGMMFWGYQVFLTALIAPFFKQISEPQKRIGFWTMIIFVCCIPYFAVDNAGATLRYTNLGPDILLGILLLYTIINYHDYLKKQSRFSLFAIIYGIFMMTLTKQLGIVFSILAIYIFVGIGIKRNVAILCNLKMCLLCTFSVILAFGSWELYRMARTGYAYTFWGVAMTVTRGKAAAFPLSVGMLIVLSIFVYKSQFARSCYEKIRFFVPEIVLVVTSIAGIIVIGYSSVVNSVDLTSYVDFFFDVNSFYIGYILRLPIAFLLVLCMFYASKLINDEFDKWIVLLISYGFIIWSLFRVASHVAFQSFDSSPLTSMNRYVYSYFLVLLAYIVFITVNKDYKQIGILLISIILMSNSSKVLKEMINQPSPRQFNGIDNVEFEYGDNIFLLDVYIDDDRCEEDFYYQVVPASSNFDAYEATWYVANNLSGRRLTPEEVSNKLLDGEYNYVYIRKIDEGFGEYYSELFDDITDLSEHHLYSVKDEGGMVKLALSN